MGDQATVSSNPRDRSLQLPSDSYILSWLLYAVYEPDRCRLRAFRWVLQNFDSSLGRKLLSSPEQPHTKVESQDCPTNSTAGERGTKLGSTEQTSRASHRTKTARRITQRMYEFRADVGCDLRHSTKAFSLSGLADHDGRLWPVSCDARGERRHIKKIAKSYKCNLDGRSTQRGSAVATRAHPGGRIVMVRRENNGVH